MSDAAQNARKYLTQWQIWAHQARSTGEERTEAVWRTVVEVTDSLITENEQLREANRPIPASYGDLSDLPPTLRRQLAGLRTDPLDDQIYTIVKAAAERGADLDIILIELWRRFRVEQTRRFIQNKTYRLAQKGIIFSVSGKKGLYTATVADARKLSPTGSAPAALPAPTDDDPPVPSEEDQDDPGI